MSEYITLKKKEFDTMIRVWKRMGLISDHYICRNDIWLPADRTPSTRPGRHVIQGPPMPEEYREFVYDAKNLINNMKELALQKHLKSIKYTVSEDSLSFALNDTVFYRVAERVTIEQFPVQWTSFDDIVQNVDWTAVPVEQLVELRDGNRIELGESGCAALIARGLLKYSGSMPTTRPINFSLKYNIAKSDDKMTPSLIHLLVDYGFFKCCHTYPFIPFQNTKR